MGFHITTAILCPGVSDDVALHTDYTGEAATHAAGQEEL